MSSEATVVDTNCIAYFQAERLTERQDGPFSQLMTLVFLRGHLAVDEGGKAEQEYKDTCRPSAAGLNLMDWFADQILKGKIKFYRESAHLKKQCQQCGLPNRDYKWVGIALSASAGLIVTQDIDLFEPKAKSWPSGTKDKIRAQGGGTVAKLLRNNGINVRCCDGAIRYHTR